MFLDSTIIFSTALVISLVLNRVMLKIAPMLGLMDEPGARRIHATPIPRAGGIAIWLTILSVLAMGLASGLVNEGGVLSWKWLLAFAAGSLILMVAGILDDRGGLRPCVKLGAHALAPIIFLLLSPTQAQLFPAHWPEIYDQVAFVVWAVVLINAFNLIDGLDGLCGGLAAVATLGLAGIAFVNQRFDAALILIAMFGAILGFLKYNMNPARIFLGDAGSMLIGFFLATAATDTVGRKAVVGMILLPIAIAGVPLIDVLLAIWRRSVRRMIKKMRGEEITGGIFEADKDHLHHRLLASGSSQRKVAGILQGIAALVAVFAFLPLIFGKQVMALSMVGLLVIGMVGLRNLARVELDQTGSAIHMAIKMQGRRRLVATTLFFYDLIAVGIAGFLGVMIETNFFTLPVNGWSLGQFVVLFVILNSLASLIVRVHLRLWVRATLRDLVSLQLSLFMAAMATFALFSFANASLEWSGLRMALMSYVFAGLAVSLPRLFLDLMREYGLESHYRHSKKQNGSLYGPVVVLGAGDLGTLLLDHLKSSSREAYAGMKVLGFLDEQKALHGRFLRSFRIFGDLSRIPGLVEKEGLRGIVVAIQNPHEDLLNRLNDLAAEYHLSVFRWKIGLAPVAGIRGEEIDI